MTEAENREVRRCQRNKAQEIEEIQLETVYKVTRNIIRIQDIMIIFIVAINIAAFTAAILYKVSTNDFLVYYCTIGLLVNALLLWIHHSWEKNFLLKKTKIANEQIESVKNYYDAKIDIILNPTPISTEE